MAIGDGSIDGEMLERLEQLDGVAVADAAELRSRRALVERAVELAHELHDCRPSARKSRWPVWCSAWSAAAPTRCSGITANPALGVASDLLVAAGGTSILAETPELIGAEHLLARRAVTPRRRGRAARRSIHRFERALGAIGDRHPRRAADRPATWPVA